MAMESCLSGSPPTTPDVLPASRPTTNFQPSIWDVCFTEIMSYEATLCEWREKAEALKGYVLKMLSEVHLPNKRSSEKLSLIDAIQRLGVAYHFEQQIEDELAHIFTCARHQFDADDDDRDDLNTVSLRFRLVREHGYNLASDVFNKFVDKKGNFHGSLCDDVDGLLSLYEAAHFRAKGEEILDEALNFTTSSLQSLASHLSPSLAKQVRDALYRPLRKTLPRLEAKNYMSIYEQNEQHSEVLLQFAKLDFNILQKLHQKELSIISKWWTDLDCATKFPFARDRVVECYFWILGVHFEPEYTVGRTFLTQVIAMASIIDDIYDTYGTKEELELFTDAVDRWDVRAIVGLPEYMKACYQQLLVVFRETEEEKMKQGRSLYGVQCAKEAMKRLLRAYNEERNWLDIGQDELPTIEEYKKVALVSSGYPMLSVASLVWMSDSASNEEAFNWMLNEPEIVKAVSIIARLMDDIVSHKFEQEREHPPSAVQCYAAQYGVSEEGACGALRKEVEEAWKDINEAFLDRAATPAAKSVLMRVLNLARVMDALYKESDGYTHVTPAIKDSITSLLLTCVQL